MTEENTSLPTTEKALESGETENTLMAKVDTNTLAVIEDKKSELLNSDMIKEVAQKIGEEDIKSDFYKKAIDIKGKNAETARQELNAELKELDTNLCREEMLRKHKYKMSQIEKDEKHMAMLDKRKKLEEQFGYLYSKNEKGELVGFSYSTLVNKLRTFTRNCSRLDTTTKKIFKWVFIIGGVAILVFLLKRFNIIN